METQMTSMEGLFGASTAQILMQNGLKIESLRTNAILNKDEWIAFDTALARPVRERLVGIQDLIDAGLTFNLANPMGKTVQEWESSTDVGPAEETMDGISRGDSDSTRIILNALPLPITHKDFEINLRTLEASRNLGESLDMSNLESSARKVAERMEDTLFKGGTVTITGNTVFGYTNHPNRITRAFDSSENWTNATKTGEEILLDVTNMKGDLIGKNFFGPYVLYIPTEYEVVLDREFKANSDKSLRTRLMEINNLLAIRVSDHLTADNVLMIQFTSDVIDLIDGFAPTVVPWESHGGFKLNFKVLGLMVPRIKVPGGSTADTSVKTGIVHMS